MFHIQHRVAKAPRIIEVQLVLPFPGWLKINADVAANGSHGMAGYGEIFRTYKGFCKGCFSTPLVVLYSYEAELMKIIWAIEFAN